MSEMSRMQDPTLTIVKQSVNTSPIIRGNHFLGGGRFYCKSTAQKLKHYTQYKNRPKQGNIAEKRLLLGKVYFRRKEKKTTINI